MGVDREQKSPLYKQVYDSLKIDIAGGKYKNGDLLPSERELSKMFEVDRITVRKSLSMLSDDGFVKKVAGLGTKVVELSPKVFAQSRNTLFVLPKNPFRVDRITEPFNASLFYCIEKECKNKGFRLMYSTLGDEDNLSDVLKDNDISGIFFVNRVDNRFINEAALLNIPSVLVNNSGEHFTSVMIDNFNGTYEAVKYLVDMGHISIGIILGGAGYITSEERLYGYKKALLDADIDWKDQLSSSGDWSFGGGYNAMKEILNAGKQLPTAVFASNDAMAIGAMDAINEAGLKIPDDISIVGFDDIEQSRYVYPKLTTVILDIDTMGRAACHNLFYSIENRQTYKVNVIIPVKLKLRESVRKIKSGSKASSKPLMGKSDSSR